MSDESSSNDNSEAEGNEIDLNNPQVQEAIRQAVDSQIVGLKTKNGELIATQKELKEKLSSFDGIDADATRELLKRFENDEDAKLIAEGKVDEVLNKRTERMRAEFENALGESRSETESAVKRSEGLLNRVRDDHLRQAAIKSGVLPEAVDDVVYLGREFFSLDETAEPIYSHNDMRYGKDGKTPLPPTEWVDGLRDNKPHWWPKPKGSGAQGDGNGSGGGKTKSRADFESLGAVERSSFLNDGGTISD